MTIKVWGNNPNHAFQRLRALQGKNLAPYEGEGKAGQPIFSVEKVELIEQLGNDLDAPRD